MVNVDGTGLKTLDVGRPADSASWLPPLGQEIVFRGQQLLDTDPAPGIWAVHPDGTGLRELSARPAVNTGDSMVLAVSPDGTRVSYTDGNSDISRVQILDIATCADIALPDPTGYMHQFGPAVYSPDGRTIANQRDDGDGTHQLVVAPSDGSGTGTPIGPRPAGSAGDIIYAWTPDGSAIIAAYDADQTARLLPVDGSTSTVLSRGSFAFVDVQRVAP